LTENLHEDLGSSLPSNVAPKAQLKGINIAGFLLWKSASAVRDGRALPPCGRELPGAMRIYDLDAPIADAKRRGMWVCSYIEAHIWNPEIKCKLIVLNQ